MSPTDFKAERMNRQEARKLISKIVNQAPQLVNFGRHALKELANDDLSPIDAWNVLRSSSAKIYSDGELKNGSYRYRLETTNLMLVIAFTADGQGLDVVTAWDKRKGKKG